MMKDMNFEDVSFVERLQKGYQVVGHRDNSVVEMQAAKKNNAMMSLDELWLRMHEFNTFTLNNLREIGFS